MALTVNTQNALAGAIPDPTAYTDVKTILEAVQALTGTEAAYIDGVTPGTATAEKALVLDASKGIATITTATITTATIPNFAGAESHAGVITPAGGVASSGGFSSSARLCHTGGVPATATSFGTNTTDNTAGMVYLAEIFVPNNKSVTGVAVFNGTAVAGNGKVMLYDSAGTRVAVSASTAMSGTTTYQLIPFTGAPIAVTGPATYFIGTIYDTTTHDLRGHTVGSFATGTDAGNTYATDSTFATVTLPTTFTADLGPVASLY